MTTLTVRTVAELPQADAAPAALDRFLASVERRALRMAEISTQDRDDALDIVQDAMMQLARRYGQHPPDQWPPLFYRILENRIHDWQRRRSVRARIFGWFDPRHADDDLADACEQVADSALPDAVDQLRNREAMDCLESALRRLPRRQREAFELRVWQGLNVEQTAAAMGCSDGSVKTHLSRALHALRAQLEGVWP